MLKKKQRANTKTVGRVFKEGASVASVGLTFKFVRTSSSSAQQFSFVAPKSIVKSAVKRNALRRLGYTVLEKCIGKFPVGVSGVFMFKNGTPSAASLESDLKTILSKI